MSAWQAQDSLVLLRRHVVGDVLLLSGGGACRFLLFPTDKEYPAPQAMRGMRPGQRHGLPRLGL